MYFDNIVLFLYKLYKQFERVCLSTITYLVTCFYTYSAFQYIIFINITFTPMTYHSSNITKSETFHSGGNRWKENVSTLFSAIFDYSLISSTFTTDKCGSGDDK